MQAHVIFVNGPPRSGKDTIGRIVTEVFPQARATKLAHGLKVGTHALFAGLRGADGAAAAAMARGANTDDAFEASKAEELPYFFGTTPRAAYIAVSELLCKPLFGKEFFGRLVVDMIRRNPEVPLWVITDSGFEDEARPIMREVGADNCTLVRLHRDGCTFAGDSRGYIDLDVPTKLDLNNNGTLDELRYLVRTAVLVRC
jgi:hypothetical protein